VVIRLVVGDGLQRTDDEGLPSFGAAMLHVRVDPSAGFLHAHRVLAQVIIGRVVAGDGVALVADANFGDP